MAIDISSNTDELSKKAADWLVGYVQQVLKEKDRFTIAMAGGNTPKKLYQLLASPGYKDKIDWSRLHFFWGDERFVPFDDDRNNAKMATDILFAHVPVNKEQVHIMRTDLEPDAAAAAYEQVLKQYFQDSAVTFDLVLLGMGDNAHTLSLFPGYDNIYEKQKWVMSFYLKEQQMHRITLTTPVVNRAARVVFLVTGGDKAVPLCQVLYGEHDPDQFPAQLIQPYLSEPLWFIDKAAAVEIEKR